MMNIRTRFDSHWVKQPLSKDKFAVTKIGYVVEKKKKDVFLVVLIWVIAIAMAVIVFFKLKLLF